MKNYQRFYEYCFISKNRKQDSGLTIVLTTGTRRRFYLDCRTALIRLYLAFKNLKEEWCFVNVANRKHVVNVANRKHEISANPVESIQSWSNLRIAAIKLHPFDPDIKILRGDIL